MITKLRLINAIVLFLIIIFPVETLFAQEHPAGEADPNLERQDMRSTVAPNRPNILYIMLDDAGYEDFTTRDLVRPNIDAFAKESMFFDNFYTNPMCSPSRTTLLSGLYQSRFGLQWVYGGGSIRGIGKTQTTVVDALNKIGYTTAHIGKWHAGAGDGYDIWDHDYDTVVTATGVVSSGYFDPKIMYSEDNLVKFKGSHRTDIFADHVIDFINEHKSTGKPFFVNYWLNAPHSPHEPSEEWRDLYADDDPYGNYKGLFSQADYNVGRVIDYIDADPILRENTIVIVTSDNGGTQKTRDVNGDFRGYKTDVFEGGTRLPLFIRWPGVIKPGENHSVISIVDLMPTLLDFAKASKPGGLDGVSFASKTHSSATVERTDSLFWMHKVESDLRSSSKFKPSLAQLSWAVRDGDWKAVYEPLDAEHIMLFNVATDPSESSDLSALYPTKINDLYRQYLDWKVDTTEQDLITKNGTRSAEYALSSGDVVEYKYDPLHNITDMDFTFVANVTISSQLEKDRIIAQKPNAWEFKINKDNKLELVQYDSKTGKTDTVRADNLALEEGVGYDVAFSIVGMKNIENYVRFYVRRNGSDSFVQVGAGVGVDAVAYNKNPIQLGDSHKAVAGKVKGVRAFVAPFDEVDLASIYSRSHTVPVVTDGVDVEEVEDVNEENEEVEEVEVDKKQENSVNNQQTVQTKTDNNDTNQVDVEEEKKTQVQPVTLKLSPSVDLKMYLYKEKQYYDNPRQMVAVRRAKFKWETVDVSSCNLKLEYKNGEETVSVSDIGSITVDRVKADNIQGLDKATLVCESDDGGTIEDSVTINLFEDSTRIYRIFVNNERIKAKKRVNREKALSLCLTDVSKYQQDNVMCTFGKKVIYAHGDTPVVQGGEFEYKGTTYEAEDDADMYRNGYEATNDSGVSVSHGGQQFGSVLTVDSSTQMANALTAFWSAFRAIFSR